MTSAPIQAKQLVLQMMRSGPVQLSGIADEKDANNTKVNLLKQWKKLLSEFAASDGTPDAEAEKLTVGIRATETPGTYIFELRPKRNGGAITPRSYQLIEPDKEPKNDNHV